MERDDMVVRGEVEPAGSRLESARAYPHEVARVLSYLANLIDGSIQLRGIGSGPREFAARILDVPPVRVVATTRELGPIGFQLAALAFAEDLAAHPPQAVIGEDEEEPPRWEQLDLGDETVSIPFSLTAAFAPATLSPSALVVFMGSPLHYDDRAFMVRVWSRASDVDDARAWLEDLVERSRRRTNPFRNRTLHALVRPGLGLHLSIANVQPMSREDLVLPEGVWSEVDRSVHGLFAGLERLSRAGLAFNRGLLLAGPPGTGKTALCRVLATELDRRVTVVFCNARAVTRAVDDLYAELEYLAPALVVIEDLDLVVGHRRRGGSSSLVEFLLALDGARSCHQGVVTVATTNDLAAIDEAARRAGRFDRVLRIDAPDAAGRAKILRGYLRAVDCYVEVARVAEVTAGRTGADLRELVTRAVLHAAGAERSEQSVPITTELLVRLADEESSDAAGQYL
jgi:hypothetical protein